MLLFALTVSETGAKRSGYLMALARKEICCEF
jgi:hypothetical protein